MIYTYVSMYVRMYIYIYIHIYIYIDSGDTYTCMMTYPSSWNRPAGGNISVFLLRWNKIRYMYTFMFMYWYIYIYMHNMIYASCCTICKCKVCIYRYIQVHVYIYIYSISLSRAYMKVIPLGGWLFQSKEWKVVLYLYPANKLSNKNVHILITSIARWTI